MPVIERIKKFFTSVTVRHLHDDAKVLREGISECDEKVAHYSAKRESIRRELLDVEAKIRGYAP